MPLFKHLMLAAVFAVSLVFTVSSYADEKTEEKNPFAKELSAIKRAEKRVQRAKNGAAKKRAEASLKKEQSRLATALKTASARYDKELKEIEEELKRKTDNDEDKEKYAAQIEKLEARKAACEEKIAKLKAFAGIESGDEGAAVKDEKSDQKDRKDEKKEKKSKKK